MEAWSKQPGIVPGTLHLPISSKFKQIEANCLCLYKLVLAVLGTAIVDPRIRLLVVVLIGFCILGNDI